MNIVFNNDAFSQTQNAIQIQKILFNLSNENYSDSLSNLKSLGLFEKKPLHETFLRNIFWAFYLCPKQHSLLFDMFIWFLTYEDQFDDVKQSTKSFLLSIFLRCHQNFASYYKFVFVFITRLIKEIDENFDSSSIKEEYYNNYFELLIHLNQSHIDILKKIFLYPEINLLYIIYHDDESKFSDYFIKEYGFDINMKIDLSDPLFPFINSEMTLIEVAASFGSSQIFKYLMVNNALFDRKTLAKYAIRGNNIEIIHLAEQNQSDFGLTAVNECLFFHHLDLFQWLINNHEIDIKASIIEGCVKSNFVEGLISLLSNVLNFISESPELDTPNNIFSSDISIISLSSFEKNGINSINNLVELASVSSSIDVLMVLVRNTEIFQLGTAFFATVEAGDLKSAEILSSNYDININAKNKRQLTPLMISAQNGDIFMCKFLVHRFSNINLNSQERYGATALHLAIRFNQVNTFEFLVKLDGIDVNCQDFGMCSPLHEAVFASNKYFLLKLLESTKIDITLKDNTSYTPLLLAISSNDVESVLLFLNSNKQFEEMSSALSLAVSSKSSEISQLLINDKRFCTILTENQNTIPLNQMVENQMIDCIKLLIDLKQFNVNQKINQENETLLHYYCKTNNCQMAKYILEKGNNVDVNAKNIYGATPLHEAIKAKDNDCVLLLLNDKRTDVNALDENNQTPLHHSARNWSQTSLTDILMHPKINVNLVDKDGKTALFVACELGIADNVEILLNDPRVDTELEIESVLIVLFMVFLRLFYYTAIQMAGRKGHMDVVNVYRKYQNTILKTKQKQESKCFIF